MISFTLKHLLMALGLSAVSLTASAHFVSSRTVLNNNDSALISVKFEQPVGGDLYLAAMVNNTLLFFGNQGKTLTNEVVPFQKNGSFSGELKLLDVSASGIAANHYPLYLIVTFPNSDPLSVTNWVGGLDGLNIANISIGLTVAETNDMNGDGFSDDDSDHDGYRDGDLNYDGVIDNPEVCGSRVCFDPPAVTPTPMPTPMPEPTSESTPDLCGSRICFRPPLL